MNQIPLLKTFPRNLLGKDYAVADIHGHFSALKKGLRAIRFNKATDRLFAVGDLVDRGPESALVLKWLSQPWFHAIKGNHEDIACAALIGGKPQDIQHHIDNGGAWAHVLSREAQRKVGWALFNLPLAIEVETGQGGVGLIHADFPTLDWLDLREGRLSPEEIYYSLWSINRYRNKDARLIQNIRAVVHGHITIPRMEVLGNTYFIHTHGGLGERGHFTFLDLERLKARRGPGGEREQLPARYRLS